jgi:hypothetical protein
MNPIKYAVCPTSRNGQMSLCHSWLGVLRSKNRGVPGFFGAFLFCGLLSCAVARVLCTVALLAGSKKTVAVYQKSSGYQNSGWISLPPESSL